MTSASPVDVAEIVDEIRREAEKRWGTGDLTQEDRERVLKERLRESIARAGIDASLAVRLLHESHDWNTDTGYRIRSDRSGLASLMIRGAKALVRPLVRLYTDHILNRQSQINLAVWHVLLDSVQKSVALEVEVRRLRKEVQDLKERS